MVDACGPGMNSIRSIERGSITFISPGSERTTPSTYTRGADAPPPSVLEPRAKRRTREVPSPLCGTASAPKRPGSSARSTSSTRVTPRASICAAVTTDTWLGMERTSVGAMVPVTTTASSGMIAVVRPRFSGVAAPAATSAGTARRAYPSARTVTVCRPGATSRRR